jgi:hypothetical protein
LTGVAIFWPAVIAWPLALIGAWFAVNLSVAWWNLRQKRKGSPPKPENPTESTDPTDPTGPAEPNRPL